MNDEWVQKKLGGVFCEDNVYNKDTITNNVQRILIFKEHLEIYCKNE